MTILLGSRWNMAIRWRGFTATIIAALMTLLLLPVPSTGATTQRGETSPLSAVIVGALPGAEQRVAQAIEQAGGQVTRALGIIGGFAAQVPTSSVPALGRAPGVHWVTPDYPVYPLHHVDTSAPNDTATMTNVASMVGADAMWQHGLTGDGVDIALVDTGVVPVDGLTYPGKVLNGPDLSFDSQAPDGELMHLDPFGHGTHLAGIIAGRDDAVADVGDRAPDDFVGVAPGARLVNVRVGSSTGAVDVSQVIAGIDWVVQYGQEDGLNVRVLNLAFGTDTTQSWTTDPLAFAVEVAWKRGIFVVVASGNDGRGTSLAMPAAHPLIMAVGASDHMDTIGTADDRVASFSTYATGSRRPEVVAPGLSVVSLRSPGSFIDETYPGARHGERFFRGSGTSQAAAVVSGAAALLVQQRPNITPDELKALLRNSATKLQGTSPNAQGAGQINLRTARTMATPTTVQSIMPGSGTGSLHQSRGTDLLTMDGIAIEGEIDIFGARWSGARWSADAWNGVSWQDGVWNGARWSGARWSGESWSGASWEGARWSDASWTGAEWDDESWSGARWSGARWSGARWSGARWSSAGWE